MVPRSAPAVLILALLIAGCSDGSDPVVPEPTASAPPVTPSPSVTPTSSVDPTAPSGQTTVSVYFMSAEHVQPVARVVDKPAIANAAVEELLAGPSAAERAAGLSSSIPSGTALRGVNIVDRRAVVDLTGRYASGGGSLSMRTRLAQVVYTLTSFPTVEEVEFRLDGVPVQTFGGEGIVLNGPVDRESFEDQAPDVLIESPAFGGAVSSPLRITGTANVFEAVFQLELVDAGGKVLTTQRVQAASGTGTRGTFTSTLTFSPPTDGSGRLVAFVNSPRDGAREDVVAIPIRFAAAP